MEPLNPGADDAFARFAVNLEPSSMAEAESTLDRHYKEFFAKFLADLVEQVGPGEESKASYLDSLHF